MFPIAPASQHYVAVVNDAKGELSKVVLAVESLKLRLRPCLEVGWLFILECLDG